MTATSGSTYFRKGFGLKNEIQGELSADYDSELVAQLKAGDRTLKVGDLEIRLAHEFGFCYGVDRAIDYAYETRKKFPDRRIFLVGEIIHNPGVNYRLEAMGVTILSPDLAEDDGPLADLTSEDVVLIPAFGVTTTWMARLEELGCVRVDTTCGSVLNVWKRVERHARDGYTSVIHGKHEHEETRATASRALAEGGHYLVVRNMDETDLVIDHLAGRMSAADLLERFAFAVSPGFEPERDLAAIGLANQTTMLSSESLAIAERLRQAVLELRGQEAVEQRFRAFDTICSATQDRQDAVVELLAGGVDLALVIGGYNSSNTCNLARMCRESVPTYHLASRQCLRDDGSLEHLPAATKTPVVAESWLPDGQLVIGLTAGASTPDSEIGAVIQALLQLRGLPAPTLS
ncbi:MAG: 4-hydroxy-3-methylbut-2-enyl diphosphate reductase [Acidobacteriota bacterium]